MKNPIIINNTPVQVVDMYKYLGVNIQTDLKWNSHVEMQVNKVSKRMYHVYCLRKLNVDSKIMSILQLCSIKRVNLCLFNMVRRVQ